MINDLELSHYLSNDAIDLDVVASKISLGANPNTLNTNLDSLLHIVVDSGDIHQIRNVLDTKIDVHICNGDGHSALYCLLNQTPCRFAAALLLIQAGASPNTVNQNGDNLLHLAARTGDLEVIKAVLALGINPHNQNRQGHTPLSEMLGQTAFHADAVALLLLNDSLTLSPAGLSSLRVQKPGARLHRGDLKRLGEGFDHKERVIRFMTQLPPASQRVIIDLCLNEHSAMGAFFYAQRGLFKPTPVSGTLAQLLEIERNLPASNRHAAIHIPPPCPIAGYQPSFFPDTPMSPPSSRHLLDVKACAL